MDALSIITLAMGAAWASGINLYATVLLVGLLETFGLVPLPDGLSTLTSPIVLGVAGVAYIIEFFADKIPGLDSIWDGIHTFIRIPAGAAMAAGATAGLGEDYMVALALLGGAAVAAGSHATKAGSRAVINTSPEPVTNWAASFFEDVLVVVGLLLALFKPVVFLIFLLVFFLAALWLLPKIWSGLWRLYQRFVGKQGPDAIADQRPGFELSSLDRND
mgnify:FL=1